MISHFWNLCRACPAVDVDKLHSEYRSTYRWYEYTPKQENQVVRRPPQPITHSGIDGVEFPRKKKHPEIAYKSHDFFDPEAATPKRASRQPEREKSSSVQRRSQSEGPVTRNPLFQSEYRLQFATARKSRERCDKSEENKTQEIKTLASHPPPAPSSAWVRKQNSLKTREICATDDQDGKEPKKSISMGQIQPKNKNSNSGMQDAGTGESSGSPTTKSREYKSEYKNKYRPFSQYEYVGDGKFFNTSTSPPSEVDGQPAVPLVPIKRKERLEGEPWYKEVQELRKAANDYKCRGWGTELVSPHVSQLYSQQLNLHEQASKRESLSALALAISTPRSMKKTERDRKNLHKFSPTTTKTARSKLSMKGKKAHSRPESAQACNNKEGNTYTLCESPSNTTVEGDKDNAIKNDAAKLGKRQKPGEFKRKLSKSSSRATSREQSRPPSAIDSQIDYFREPVVKSPPEPTRVKSPEQLLIRSPDPINWTVPLDTGKTFSVTQSVRDTDSARNSPMSDHSSHFDSVSGTAIHLGNYAINDKGSLQYPKVSALAREAKELVGIKQKEEIDEDCQQKLAENSSESEQRGYQENTKCLEDPNFAFEENDKKTQVETLDEQHQEEGVKDVELNKSSIENECLRSDELQSEQKNSSLNENEASQGQIDTKADVPPSSAKKPKGSPYKVLEDPGMMTASIYMPYENK